MGTAGARHASRDRQRGRREQGPGGMRAGPASSRQGEWRHPRADTYPSFSLLIVSQWISRYLRLFILYLLPRTRFPNNNPGLGRILRRHPLSLFPLKPFSLSLTGLGLGKQLSNSSIPFTKRHIQLSFSSPPNL